MGIIADFWRGRRVFVTGHTGFKGSWLCLWLKRLGAVVNGYALPPETSPSLFELANVGEGMTSRLADIRDLKALRAEMIQADPEIVFHLAAQPLVRSSYRLPVETFETNVMGTVHLLEGARSCSRLRVVQVITTDKVYEDREWSWPYRENDALGGRDPYSASKAACEMVVASYRQSYLDGAGVSVSSVRAGNVIGGGDWAQDRLLPDCMRAFQVNRPVTLRRPGAVRPWQHVMEPLAGYLLLAQEQWREPLAAGERRYARAFNFGPNVGGEATVGSVARLAAQAWGADAEVIEQSADPAVLHEAGMLTLDSSLARRMLGWRTQFSVAEAVALTVDWYRRCKAGEHARELCHVQIDAYQRSLPSLTRS